MYSPIFVFSDCHLGAGQSGVADKGLARDNFEVWSHADDLFCFLDFIEKNHPDNGSVVIAGDLFEFWQASVGDVLTVRKKLLDRLAAFGQGDLNRLRYIPGNHDVDLNGLGKSSTGSNDWLKHPFFNHMGTPFTEMVGDRYYHFLHGHEGDPFNSGSFPGSGRVLSILAAMVEDKVGSPYFDAAQTKSVEGSLSVLGHSLLGFWNWLTGGITQRNADKKALRGTEGSSAEPVLALDSANSDMMELENHYLEASQKGFAEASTYRASYQDGQIISQDDNLENLAMAYLAQAWTEYIKREHNQRSLRSHQSNVFVRRGATVMVSEQIGQMKIIRETLEHKPIMICGHTHVSGRHADWYFNSGSWIDKYGAIIRITDDTEPELFEWSNNSLKKKAWTNWKLK